MFRAMTLHGPTGAIVWGYRDVATVTSWKVRKFRDDDRKPWRWVLDATIATADHFCLRQRPLIFTAPRKAGQFCFPVRELNVAADATRLTANLGPPEH